MNLTDLLLSLTTVIGLLLAVPALASEPNGEGGGESPPEESG